jgi:hypothetical protein
MMSKKKSKAEKRMKRLVRDNNERKISTDFLSSLDNAVTINSCDSIDSWAEYKKMVDFVYFNQKRRTKKLDEIHATLNHVGDEVEAKVPGQGDAYVEHLCQQMKKIVFLSWDTNKNQNFITGTEQSEQSLDALSFRTFKGFSDEKMKGILDLLVTTSFFEPDDVYHYLD